MNPLQHHVDIIGTVIRAAVPVPKCCLSCCRNDINDYATRASGVCRAWRAAVRRLIGPLYAEWLAAREAMWLRRKLYNYHVCLEEVAVMTRLVGIHPHAHTKRPLSDARRLKKHQRLELAEARVSDFRKEAKLRPFSRHAGDYEDCLTNVARSLASQAW